jgi:hypothetical protein
MSRFTRGTSFETNGSYAADTLHQLIEDADAQPAFITGKTALTSTATDDYALVSDTSDSGNLKKVALSKLLPQTSVPRVAGWEVYHTTFATTFQVRSDDAYGIATTADGSTWRLLKSKQDYTDQTAICSISYSAPASSVVVGATGTGFGKTPTTNRQIDANGTVQAVDFRAEGDAPIYRLVETGNDTVWVLEEKDGEFQLQHRPSANDSSVAAVPALRVAKAAPASSLSVAASGYVGIGTVGPSYALDVVGTVRATNYLLPEYTVTAATPGSAGQVLWKGNDLFVCKTTGTPGTWVKFTGVVVT